MNSNLSFTATEEAQHKCADLRDRINVKKLPMLLITQECTKQQWK
jgi:hypothetical protein